MISAYPSVGADQWRNELRTKRPYTSQAAGAGKGLENSTKGQAHSGRKRPIGQLATMDNELKRDHLVISYATEDSDCAEWLALRLTGEGYRAWCDRTHL